MAFKVTADRLNYKAWMNNKNNSSNPGGVWGLSLRTIPKFVDKAKNFVSPAMYIVTVIKYTKPRKKFASPRAKEQTFTFDSKAKAMKFINSQKK